MNEGRWAVAGMDESLRFAHWRALAVGLVLAMVPLWGVLPWGFTGGALLVLALRLWQLRFKAGRGRLAVLLGYVLLAGAGLVWQGMTQGWMQGFLMLLAAMAVAKFLEARNHRDVQVLFLLAMALLMAGFMYSQSIGMFVYVLCVVAINLWALWLVECRFGEAVFGVGLKTCAQLLLWALPFAIGLFFIFPRLDPLWAVPRLDNTAVTGLPEEMSMGDIGQLAQSNEVAFRVRFADAQVPSGDKLYWRGPVLWLFDGLNWKQWQGDFHQQAEVNYASKAMVDYEWTAVSEDLNWLLALDVPVGHPRVAQMGRAMQLRLPKNTKTRRFQMRSALDYTLGGLSDRERAMALQLPHEIPKTRALAQRIWEENGASTEGFVAGFLRYLQEEDFYYSLAPLPGAGDVENFLFAKERVGFCEHYANALAQAARSIGVPSRVVVGYQGGEFNPLNGDWLVRQEYAHAWVEIWYEERGWVRVDPTAAVAPSRIEQARLSSESLTAGGDTRALSSRIAERLQALAWARNAFAYSQALWQDWVIDLDDEKQRDWWQKLALFGWIKGLFIGGCVLGLVGWLLWRSWQKRRLAGLSLAQQALKKLLARLAKQGYEKNVNESVAVFLRRIAPEFESEKALVLRRLAMVYEQVYYHENENDSQLLSIIKRTRL